MFRHNFIYVMRNARDVHETFLVEIEARTRSWSPRPRPRPRRSVSRPRRNRGIWNFNRGETKPRHYCASRWPRDRGVKTEATFLLFVIYLLLNLTQHITGNKKEEN